MSITKENPIHVAFAIDDSFTYPLAATLISLLENHKNKILNIHLFSASLSKEYVPIFRDIVEKYDQKFDFYHLDKNIFNDFPITDRISHASYYRLVMAENINPVVEKFLYLDADIIINGNLTALFELNLEGKIFAAVNDVAAIDVDMHLKHNVPEKYLYFNAGVMLIDKTLWLKKNCTEKVISYLKDNIQICDFHDQDALNGSLYMERKNISPIYNQQIGLFYIDKNIIQKSYPEDVDKALNHPLIIHYNGREKPWNYGSGHPFKKSFKKYANKIESLHYSEKPNFKKFVKGYIIYNLIGWSRINQYYNNKAKK